MNYLLKNFSPDSVLKFHDLQLNIEVKAGTESRVQTKLRTST
jgi:hypothetical protein